jgi:hypothetical protein
MSWQQLHIQVYSNFAEAPLCRTKCANWPCTEPAVQKVEVDLCGRSTLISPSSFQDRSVSLAASTRALITPSSPSGQPAHLSCLNNLTGASSADIPLAHVRFVDGEITEATKTRSILSRIFALKE